MPHRPIFWAEGEDNVNLLMFFILLWQISGPNVSAKSSKWIEPKDSVLVPEESLSNVSYTKTSSTSHMNSYF